MLIHFFSIKYEVIQATQYPHVREMVLKSTKVDWKDRPTINDIFKEIKEENTIYCNPLSVSQSNALEKINKKIITRK